MLTVKDIILIVLGALFLACTTESRSVDKIFHVIKHPVNDMQDYGDSPAPPPPLIGYYGDFNFILFDNSTVYFHDNHVNRSCGTGIDNSKPPRVDLTPGDISKIELSELPTFLAENLPDSIARKRRFFASIASPTDTIRNLAFKVITDYFREKELQYYTIRRWTEEEKYATLAKVQGKRYTPDTINWKVGFDVVFKVPDSTDNE